MEDLKNLLGVEENIEKLERKVEMLSTISDDDLSDYIGVLLIDNEATVNDEDDGGVVIPLSPDVAKSCEFLASGESFLAVARVKGEKFKKRLERAICSNTAIFTLLGNDEDRTVEKLVKTGIDTILAALGFATGGIWGLLAVALVFLVKLGYNAYCGDYWDTHGKPNAQPAN